MPVNGGDGYLETLGVEELRQPDIVHEAAGVPGGLDYLGKLGLILLGEPGMVEDVPDLAGTRG